MIGRLLHSRALIDVAEPRRDADVTKILLARNGGRGSVVDNPHLNFEFVQREVVPERSTGVRRRGRRIDWLLRNASDSVPILAELKFQGDKDPFFALIQLLMYAAMLSTGPQRARLRLHVPQLTIPQPPASDEVSEPWVDLYIVLVEHRRLESELTDHAKRMSEALLAYRSVCDYVRRIACLETRLTAGPLEFKTVFAVEP